MQNRDLPVRDHCVGCPSLEAALKSPNKYGFETRLDLARCAFRYCKHPGEETKGSSDEAEESLCGFGQMIFKADAIAGAVKYLGISEIEAENFLGYTDTQG